MIRRVLLRNAERSSEAAIASIFSKDFRGLKLLRRKVGRWSGEVDVLEMCVNFLVERAS